LTIEQEIFAVLTDTFHKPGFKLHVLVLQHLFCLVCALLLSFPSFRHDQLWLMMVNEDATFQVESGALTEPLWDAATISYSYPNNAMFVREYTIKLLGTSFPNMTASEVRSFIYIFFCYFIMVFIPKQSIGYH
jgi:exportin-1